MLKNKIWLCAQIVFRERYFYVDSISIFQELHKMLQFFPWALRSLITFEQQT